MCIKIDVLFSIIRVERMWCGILVGVDRFINNGDMFDGRDPIYNNVDWREGNDM